MNALHFRVYFIPLPGCFSPFPRGTIRYRSLYLFRLGWWSTQIQAGFHVSDPTQGLPTVLLYFNYGALTLFGCPFQAHSFIQNQSDIGALQPPINKTMGFGLFPFRSPLLRESLLISFPLLLRCFSSQSDLRRASSPVSAHDGGGVSSFGNPRLITPA